MNYVWAFVAGGLICVVGQLFIDYTKLSPARILTGYVVAGVILSAVGLYKPLVDFAGAGASVPLLGFGHLLAQGVQNAVDECGLPGAFTGGLTAASGGIAASLIFGVLAALVGKSKDQNFLFYTNKQCKNRRRGFQLSCKNNSLQARSCLRCCSLRCL